MTNPRLALALAMYEGTPCRVCGEPMTMKSLHTAVWAGASKGDTAVIAHRECFVMKRDEAEWAHQ